MTLSGRRGEYNSSKTRVRPFFEALLDKDPSGGTWLPDLLHQFLPTLALSRELLADPGPIQAIVFETDTQNEKAIAPPYAFLEWLIRHSDRMTWPKGKAGEFSPETRARRIDLLGLADSDALTRQVAARECALRELEHYGSERSFKKWWAFEGFTKVDCFIATDRLKIYVEGKRTELLSPATAWFPQRNQLVRNLEAAREDAGAVPFVCLVLRENSIHLSTKELEAGLPHMAPSEREKLMQHYVGDISWQQACEATCVNVSALPETCF